MTFKQTRLLDNILTAHHRFVAGNVELGQRIRAAYLAAGYNRSSFAKRIRVSYTTPYCWEKGTKLPSLKNLSEAALATGCSVDELKGDMELDPNEGPEGPEAPYPAWEEFLSTELGSSMTAAERATLASVRFFDRPPSASLYQAWLLDVRGLVTSTEASSGALATGKAAVVRKKLGIKKLKHPKR